jgi:hypothetical protein
MTAADTALSYRVTITARPFGDVNMADLLT